MTTADTRADYIAGLRALADLLDKHEELPLPYHGRNSDLLWIESGTDTLPVAQTFARTIPGSIDKRIREQDGAFDLLGQIHGLRVAMILNRDAVCTRVVTGTREVTEEIPDPAALAAVPKTTVTRTEEVAEWVCQPFLADREQVSA